MMSPRVLVTGVFDVLHQEHVNFLFAAKKIGHLMVGIESDARVFQIKGDGRPINPAEVRVQNLLDLGIADEVFVLPEKFNNAQDHRDLLKSIKPDVLAVSSHTLHIDEKRRLMKEIGGKVEIVHQHNPNVSTSKLLAW